MSGYVPFPLAVNVGGPAARRRSPFFKTKKIALLGSTGSLAFAPWHDPSWTLVAHPCCRKDCKREPDWYFDLHIRKQFQHTKKRWHVDYYEWLTHLQTPVFMQEYFKDIPMAVRYPQERIFGEFRNYFTNHCAYMIALAMTEGVTHIGLFGCQYAGGGEREKQRESLLYWLGRFEQAGGTVAIPPAQNSLFTMPLYGYASHDEETGKLVPAYAPPKTLTITNTKNEVVELQPVDDDPSKRIPLMPPPNGDAIAWEHSGLVAHG
jgi:hypothetical protein